jgi:peptidoglycan/LPS O-acetylase OafA/YrhL
MRNRNNFDFLRLLAASFVLIGHSSDVLYGRHLEYDPARKIFDMTIQSLGVLIFFIISGYLITRSFENRKSWVQFMVGRVLRIFPALIVVVLLSVFVLGPAVTTLSIPEYFNSPLTWKYLQDITLYRMYYYLPGVFQNNPLGGSVNASLWTLPYEFTCYLFISIAGLVTVLNRKWITLSYYFIFFCSYLFLQTEMDKLVIPVLGIDFKTFFLPFLYFMAGSVFYKFRDFIKFSWFETATVILILILVRLGIVHNQFTIIPLTYFVLAFSLSKYIKLGNAAKYGDFSYGIYLYAFPVQQLIVFLFPGIASLWLMIFLSFCIVLPFALISWHVIEKGALAKKKYFV